MVGEVIAGLGALKTAFDMAQGLQKIHDAVARDRAAIELQKEIVAAQAAQLTLLERVSELEREVAGFEKWEAEKERYALKDFGGNSFAYELKPEASKGEPPHRICPNCYENRKKAILQFQFVNSRGREQWKCGTCDNEIEFGHPQPFSPIGRTSYSPRR
jgi:hypothetical protein